MHSGRGLFDGVKLDVVRGIDHPVRGFASGAVDLVGEKRRSFGWRVRQSVRFRRRGGGGRGCAG